MDLSLDVTLYLLILVHYSKKIFEISCHCNLHWTTYFPISLVADQKSKPCSHLTNEVKSWLSFQVNIYPLMFKLCLLASYLNIIVNIVLQVNCNIFFWEILDVFQALTEPYFFHDVPAARWVSPPDVSCMQPNNRFWCICFHTFKCYFTSTWRMAGVWYLVSLATPMPDQIEQSGFNATTQTMIWL